MIPTKATTWLAWIAAVMLATAGMASASSGLLSPNSCQGKNALAAGLHQASASVSGGTHRGCAGSCSFDAAGLFVAPKTAFRVAEAGEAVNIGRGDALQHFTDLKGASGITGVSEEALAALKPGQQIVVDSAHFKPGTNPFLTGEGGGVGVTKLGPDATAGQLEGIGVFGNKQQFVVEFSQETLVNNKVVLDPTKPSSSIWALPGDTTLNGTITIKKVR